MQGDEIADLIRANQQPEPFRIGTIVSWNADTGNNSVMVDGTVLNDLQCLAPSVGTEYAPGQTVLILRKRDQYVVFGRMQVPGGLGSTPAKQVDGQGGNLSGTAGVWRDLDAGPSVSPSFTLPLAYWQRVCVFFGVASCWARGAQADISIVLTSPDGNNTLATPGSVLGQTLAAGQGVSTSQAVISAPSKSFFIRVAGNQLGPGNVTFSLKYKYTDFSGGTGLMTLTGPWILAIPF